MTALWSSAMERGTNDKDDADHSDIASTLDYDSSNDLTSRWDSEKWFRSVLHFWVRPAQFASLPAEQHTKSEHVHKETVACSFPEPAFCCICAQSFNAKCRHRLENQSNSRAKTFSCDRDTGSYSPCETICEDAGESFRTKQSGDRMEKDHSGAYLRQGEWHTFSSEKLNSDADNLKDVCVGENGEVQLTVRVQPKNFLVQKVSETQDVPTTAFTQRAKSDVDHQSEIFTSSEKTRMSSYRRAPADSLDTEVSEKSHDDVFEDETQTAKNLKYLHEEVKEKSQCGLKKYKDGKQKNSQAEELHHCGTKHDVHSGRQEKSHEKRETENGSEKTQCVSHSKNNLTRRTSSCREQNGARPMAVFKGPCAKAQGPSNTDIDQMIRYSPVSRDTQASTHAVRPTSIGHGFSSVERSAETASLNANSSNSGTVQRTSEISELSGKNSYCFLDGSNLGNTDSTPTETVTEVTDDICAVKRTNSFEAVRKRRNLNLLRRRGYVKRNGVEDTSTDFSASESECIPSGTQCGLSVAAEETSSVFRSQADDNLSVAASPINTVTSVQGAVTANTCGVVSSVTKDIERVVDLDRLLQQRVPVSQQRVPLSDSPGVFRQAERDCDTSPFPNLPGDFHKVERDSATSLESGVKSMVPLEVSESVAIVKVPRFSERSYETRVEYSDMRRHKHEVKFEPTLAPVRFADTMIVYGKNNTRKRYVSRTFYEPRVKPKRFADTDYVFPKDKQEKFAAFLDYHIDECRKWFKTCLELKAKTFTTVHKPQPGGTSVTSSTDVSGVHNDVIVPTGPGASQVLIPPRKERGLGSKFEEQQFRVSLEGKGKVDINMNGPLLNGF